MPYAPAPPTGLRLVRSPLHTVRRPLLAVLVVLLVAILVRGFVGSVFVVDSTSMEPTIHATPERVFVRFERAFRPGRFDLVVFQGPDSGAIVKRAAGLPSESLLISGGDLLIEGRRLAADAPRPEPIPLFRFPGEGPETAFQVTGAELPASPAGRRLDAGGRRAELTLARPALDDWIDADGRVRAGKHPVNDLRLEARLGFSGSGKVTLRLTEEADGFELELEVEDGRLVRWRALRRPGDGQVVELASGDAPAEAGLAEAPIDASLENVDNQVEVVVGSAHVVIGYDANTPRLGVVDEKDRHLMPRVQVAAAGLAVEFHRLAVLRDVCYTPDGPIGTGSPVVLAPDEIFVLGDNSSDSHDSRWLGPVRLSELTGRAVGVVWPPAAARRLGRLRRLGEPQLFAE